MGKRRKTAKSKEVDLDVEEYLVSRTSDPSTGGDVTAKPDDALFHIDTTDDRAEYRRVRDGLAPTSKRSREATPLGYVEALATRKQESPAPPVVRRTGLRGDTLAQRRAAAKLKAGAKKPSELLKGRRQAQRRARADVGDDLWGEDGSGGAHSSSVADAKAKNGGPGLGSTGSYDTSLRQRKLKGSKPQVEGVKAVEIAAAGLSYNPSFESHQEALRGASEIEERRQAELRRALDKLAPEPNMHEIQGIVVDNGQDDGDNSGTDDHGSVEKGDGHEGEEAGSKPRNAKERVTDAQRNRRLRHKVLLQEQQERKAEKRVLGQIDQARSIVKQIEAEAKLSEEKQRRRQEREAKRVQEPAFRGKFKFEDTTSKVVEVPLSEELSGNLRSMQVQGSVMVDRYKSMQRRALIEPRKKHKLKRRYKLKSYSKHKGEAPELRLKTAKIKDPQRKKKKQKAVEKATAEVKQHS